MSLRSKLLSRSAIMFAIRIFGAGLMFLVQAGIARTWGQSTLGDYLLVLATANIVAAVMPMGFQTVGSYFAAEYGARGQGQLLRRFVKRTYFQSATFGLLVICVCWILAQLSVFGDELYAQNWFYAAVLAIATAFVFINASLLTGLKRPIAGFAADGIFRPMLLIGSFVISLMFAGADEGLSTLLAWMAGGFFTVAMVHMIFAIVVVSRIPDGLELGADEPKRWWRFAAPWVLITLATDFFFDLDLISLSAFLDRDELAVFGVCARIFSLVSFGAAAVYTVLLPSMFEDQANSDRDGFLQKIGDANVVATGISAILFVGVSLMGWSVLLLFGNEFLIGSVPLAILCLALVVRSMFGPASIVLSIHDRPHASLPGVVLGILTLLAANWVLVPPLGLLGAALAALIAVSIWSGALWFTALKVTGVDVSIYPRVKSLKKIKSQVPRAPSV